MDKKFAGFFILLFFCLSSLALRSQTKPQAGKDSLSFRSVYRPNISRYHPSSSATGTTTPFLQSEAVAGASGLPLFGIDLFKKGPEVRSETGEVYVLPPNYKLGPGDRIGVFLLGKVQENLEVTVNIEGKVFVPPVGVLDVWGLSVDELKNLLSRKLSRYYDNYQLDVMILQPKNVMTAVVGEVLNPGKYVLSAMNTVLDAIVLAGGPTERGSMRAIKLIREREPYASVDLYQFLMSGNNEYDVFLESGDRVYVPLAQERVTLEGEINRPAIFELKPSGDETLSDLIEFAGGFTEYAYLQKIEISRLQASGQREVFYVDYRRIAAGDSTRDFALQAEDRIHVYSKLEQVHERQVSIYGEVRRPGAYELEDNMHLSDLILKAGNLTRKAYTLEAEVAKVTPGQPTRFLKVNLNSFGNGANGNSDILLEEDDQVFIRGIPEWEVGLTVQVQGEVRFPGAYSIVKDSTYLSEILQKAGGFTEDAFLQEAVVIRESSRLCLDKEFERLKELRREEMSDLEYQYFVMKQNSADVNHIVVDFERLVYEKDPTQDIILEDGDVITVPRAPRVITITGSVSKPGGVTFVERGNLDYYLARAGGVSWDADPNKTKIIKTTGEVLDDEDVEQFEPGDIIWVPRKSDKKFWPTFLQAVTVSAQLASIYLVIITAIDKN